MRASNPLAAFLPRHFGSFKPRPTKFARLSPFVVSNATHSHPRLWPGVTRIVIAVGRWIDLRGHDSLRNRAHESLRTEGLPLSSDIKTDSPFCRASCDRRPSAKVSNSATEPDKHMPARLILKLHSFLQHSHNCAHTLVCLSSLPHLYLYLAVNGKRCHSFEGNSCASSQLIAAQLFGEGFEAMLQCKTSERLYNLC